MNTIEKYSEDIYAGVLGKLIGVYMGRPVEGWTYEKIQKYFGEINFYKNTYTGAPLIVPDDDISGTFAFYRGLEDNGYSKDISAKQIGDTWLNYIVENKTILWWGGLSRSTEHTAYLRLKNGIEAPKSGSTELNGTSMAEQIGAQIFIDTWALVNPNNPELTAKMAREAASVSHDGIAVEAAVYLAVMESMAFEEKNMDVLLDKALPFISHPLLISLIQDIRSQCSKTDDWHVVRQWIADNHGYEKYPGNCPMVTNHLVVLMALIMGGDNFQKSLSISCSAGWDTDCNAGNVGALNGIRLGIDGINAGVNFRKSVADRMYICTADGGSCITDAVIETRKALYAASKLANTDVTIPTERFAFEYRGSTQGFLPYENCVVEQVVEKVENAFETENETGLLVSYKHLARGTQATISVDTFVDMKPKGVDGTSYFEVITSPSLYETQVITAQVKCKDSSNPNFTFFIDCYDGEDSIKTILGEPIALKPGNNTIVWEVPKTGGHAIYRLGVKLTSETRLDGSIIIKSIDWSDAPENFYIGHSMVMMPSLTPWTTQTTWLKSFVSSAENFYPDYTTTFSVSHSRENGVVTTGTTDWKDYSVASQITFSQQKCAGLVLRSKGHKRYYCAVLRDGKAVIEMRKDENTHVVCECEYDYSIDNTYDLLFSAKGNTLILAIDGKVVVSGNDDNYSRGGAGYLVEEGAMLAYGFTVKKL